MLGRDVVSLHIISAVSSRLKGVGTIRGERKGNCDEIDKIELLFNFACCDNFLPRAIDFEWNFGMDSIISLSFRPIFYQILAIFKFQKAVTRMIQFGFPRDAPWLNYSFNWLLLFNR